MGSSYLIIITPGLAVNFGSKLSTLAAFQNRVLPKQGLRCKEAVFIKLTTETNGVGDCGPYG